jgi:arylsulfatase A
MRRRQFISTLAGAPAILSAQSSSRPPNIVVALCDDLGYGDLSCFGHPAIKTPRLDRFAAEGVRFTDCYAGAPVCSPSRAGMVTGRIPYRAGIYDWIPEKSPMHLRRDETTFATLLAKSGYATCHSGKWHLNGGMTMPGQTTPGDHGFSHWFSTQNNAGPSHRNPRNFFRNGKPAGPLEGYSADIIVDEALSWLANLDSKQPFCLYLCFHEPHEPVASADDLVALYPQASSPDQAQYFANVTQVDRAFGRLLDSLDKRGQRDDTFVLFTSDNGPETLNRYKGAQRSHGSPGPLRGMKLHLWEGGIRVPGIARFPGRMKPGLVSSTPICNLDVLPTACALAGVRPPANRTLDGTNLLPALEARPLNRARPLSWHYFNPLGEPRAVLRDGDWKIAGIPANPNPRPPAAAFQLEFMDEVKTVSLDRFELYNLSRDPGEKSNLAASEPARLKRMSDLLVRRHKEVQAEGPDWRKV